MLPPLLFTQYSTTRPSLPDPPAGPQLFLTHLHSDHIADAPQLLALGPMMGGRKGAPLHVYGPSGPTAETGTAAFVDGLNRMLA